MSYRNPRPERPDDEGRPTGPRPSARRDRATAPAPVRMLAFVRKSTILDAVRQSGSVQVAEIAARLSVSEMTIRRDLLELERDGHLKRFHGGAVALQAIAVDRDEPSFDARLGRDRVAKDRVAAAAVPLVEGANTVALDVGATTFLLAQHLRATPGLRLFTTSLRIATALAGGPQQVYVPGGCVRGTEMAIGGPAAIEAFDQLWFDVAFIGVSGITADGLFDYSIEDTEMKRVYLGRSSRKVVLCDASKFQRMSLVRVAGFAAIDVLVTDAPPPADILAALEAAEVEVVLAPLPTASAA